MERRRSRPFNLNARIKAWRLQMARMDNVAEADLDELEDHLREQVAELLDSGRTPAEAFELARLRLGEGRSLDRAFLAGDRASRSPLTDARDLVQSCLVTARRLARSPIFSLVTVATLAIGIGAVTTIFTLVYGVLLQPLPYPEPDRLVSVFHTAPGLGYDEVPQALATFLTYQEHSETLDDMGLWFPREAAITGRGKPEYVPAMDVTPGIFRLFGAVPPAGRLTVAEDMVQGSPLHVVLDHGYWQSAFGADPGAVGQILRVNGSDWEIVGVLSPGFRILDEKASLYFPFRFDRAALQLTNFSYNGVARLAPGADLESAREETSRLLPTVTEEFKRGLTLSMLREAGFDTRVIPLKSELVGDVQSALWILLATVGLILLIAWVNVFNLFVVRIEGQHNEMAVRRALGAGRRRLLALWLREGAAVGTLGGAAGVALAVLATGLVLATAPEGLPRIPEIRIDATVLAFNFAVAVAAGLLLGLLPMIRHRSGDLSGALKEGGRGRTGRGPGRLRGALVVAEVALALVLIVAAGLMIRSLASLNSVDPGFRDPGSVLTFRLPIPFNEIRSPEAAAGTVRQIIERIAELPGVESVAATHSFPMDGRSAGDSVEAEAFPVPKGELPPIHRVKFIAGDYFRTVRIPLIAGRGLDLRDFSERRAVAVVSEAYVRTHWRRPEQALGQRLRISESRWHEIVGVSGDVRDLGLREDAPGIVYMPAYDRDVWGNEDFFQRQLAYVVRAEREPLSLLGEVERVILDVNANLPIAEAATLDAVLQRDTAQTSFTVLMLAIASAIAVLLGAIGTYGVLSYAAAERTREIGLRMALGADTGDIRRMVLRQGGIVAASGAVLGLVAALGFSRWMDSLLFGVSPADPSTYAVAALLVAAIALLASYLPARRAAGVDPMRALRWE